MFSCNDLKYVVTVAPNGDLAEVSSATRRQARIPNTRKQSAVVCSIALQFGVPVVHPQLLLRDFGRAASPRRRWALRLTTSSARNDAARRHPELKERDWDMSISDLQRLRRAVKVLAKLAWKYQSEKVAEALMKHCSHRERENVVFVGEYLGDVAQSRQGA